MHWLAAVERLRREREPGRAGHRRRGARARAARGRRQDGRRPPTTSGGPSAAATSRRPPSPGPASCSPDRAGRARVDDHVAQRQGAAPSTAGSAAAARSPLLLEPLAVVPSVAVFGVGHVGLELARILARHDLELHLVDSRADQLTDERLACLDDGQARRPRPPLAVLPELVLGEVPRGTHVLVMTHDHAEDFALCDAALRCAHLGSIGLIGSSAKWARFRQGLAVEGHDEATIARIHSPIGQPDLAGKDPATIAVGVAAELLRGRSQADRGRAAADDALPGAGPRHPGRPVHRRRAAQRRRRRAAGRRRRRSSSAAPSPTVRAAHPDEEVVDLRGGVLLPGLVDTHVHFPQVRVIGALGMPLLEWLERCALPEECRLAEPAYAQEVARGVRRSGWRRPAPPRPWSSAPTSRRRSTRCSPRPPGSGCGSPAGLVVSDRGLPEALLTTPERAYDEALALAERWHGVGRTRYAVTPRFSLSAGDELLDACAAVLQGRARTPGSPPTSTRTPPRSPRWRGCSPDAEHYVDTYDRHGLVGERSVLAHNVHADRRRARRARRPGRVGRALPDQQLRARQRAVPAAPPRRARRPGRARLRRRRRHRLLAAQGGAAGLLHAVAARAPRACR